MGTTLQPHVFTGTRIGSGVSWFRWPSVEAIWHGFWEAGIHVTHAKTGILAPQRGVPQALIFLGVVRFIAWRLRRSFLRKWRRGPRPFWEYWTCLGYGPALGPNLNRLCATLIRLVRRATNTCATKFSLVRFSLWVSCRWYIHIVVTTRTQLGRNPVLFYQQGQIS